jgi:hypothetical protein
VAEGTRLLSEYTGNRIEGSNPFLSDSTLFVRIFLWPLNNIGRTLGLRPLKSHRGKGRAHICAVFFQPGEMAERLKAHAWKACIRETVSGVRIPFSPITFAYRDFGFEPPPPKEEVVNPLLSDLPFLQGEN